MHFWLQSNEHNRNYVCFCQSDSGFEGKRGMYLSVSGKWVQYYVENAFHSYVNIFLDLLQLLLILLFLCLVRFLVWSQVSSATSLSCLLTLSRVRKSFIFSLKLGYSIITTRMCIPFYWICDSSYTSRDSHLQIPMDKTTIIFSSSRRFSRYFRFSSFGCVFARRRLMSRICFLCEDFLSLRYSSSIQLRVECVSIDRIITKKPWFLHPARMS